MTVASHHGRYTIEEYLRLEEYSNVRHEYFDGQIYAKAGGTPEHAALAANVAAALVGGLRDRPCRVYTSDARVRVVETGLDTYPDVSVVCGHEERDTQDANALTNPVVLVEVLSPSTEDYDRGEKLSHYRRIPTLREVVFVSHRERLLEVWRRGDGEEWSPHQAQQGESMFLHSVECALDVDEIYRDPFAAR